jgi:hypothetical protein
MCIQGRRLLVCVAFPVLPAALARPVAAQESGTSSGSPFGNWSALTLGLGIHYRF